MRMDAEECPGGHMLSPRSSMRFIASLAAVAAAALFGHFVVYRVMIVPALPELRVVPLWMWVATYALEGIAVVVCGLGLRSWRAVAVYAVAAAAVRVALEYAFAVTHQPGHLKSFEDPAFQIAMSLPFWTIVYGLLLAAASARSRNAARRALSGGASA